MPITIKTDNPLLIASPEMYRVAQVEIEISWVRQQVTGVKGDPISYRETPLFCEALSVAKTLNMERESETILPWGIFDDRGVFIYSPFVDTSITARTEAEIRLKEGEKGVILNRGTTFSHLRR